MIDDRLAELGITLPEPAAPVASYVPTVQAGNLLHVSGQLPFDSGQLATGRLGEDRDVEFGTRAARLCGIMLLAQIKKALGSLDRVDAVLKVLGMVNAVPDFKDHPKVINGCSDLFVEVLGEAGKHARSAVGMGSLPNQISVEIEAVLAVKP